MKTKKILEKGIFCYFNGEIRPILPLYHTLLKKSSIVSALLLDWEKQPPLFKNPPPSVIFSIVFKQFYEKTIDSISHDGTNTRSVYEIELNIPRVEDDEDDEYDEYDIFNEDYEGMVADFWESAF